MGALGAACLGAELPTFSATPGRIPARNKRSPLPPAKPHEFFCPHRSPLLASPRPSPQGSVSTPFLTIPGSAAVSLTWELVFLFILPLFTRGP